ncbi:MAG TPA: tetratricopeptide repeat protein [Opitutaceae bacterium]|nr:tetratricopeptide repeat protein [Opitutaceae bacterium]
MTPRRPEPPPAEAPPPAGTPAARTAWMLILLLGGTLLAYLPALRGGFLWDDDAHVTRPDLQPLSGLGRIWFEVGATQQYYPLLHSAFWLEHRLWGDAPLGYHLLNILLHATAAGLLGVILRRLALPGAWLAAFLFALHPVAVESVAWISEQKNTLSAVLALAATLVYLRFDRDRRPAAYGVALGLFVLALLTKSVTATLPAVLLVVFWWQRGRLAWRRDVFPLTPWFAIGATVGLFTAWVEKYLIGAQGADFTLSFADRCLLAGRVVWFYLGRLLWPADLMFIYPRWQVDASRAGQYLYPVALLVLAAALAWLARRRRGPLAGFLIFAGTLFPAMGFINVYPFVFSYVADHFQYLSAIGIIVPAAAGLTLATAALRSSGAPGAARAAPWAAVLLVAGLGVLTWRQCGIYRDARTLYTDTLRRNPDCALAHNGIGEILLRDPSRLAEAIAHFRTSIRLSPHDALAHNNLGTALARNPRELPEAIAEYETALRLLPDFAGAHNNLGVALERLPGRMAEAVAHLEEAVQIEPDSPEMQDNLGVALTRVAGHGAEAVTHLEAAVRLAPDAADYRNNLGVALVNTPGRAAEAVAPFEAAVRLNPRSAEFRANLASLLVNMPGRWADGVAQFEAAVQLKPDLAKTHDDLGNALALAPERLPEAIRQLEEAARLEPRWAKAQGDLGRVLLHAPGRLPEAVAHLETALRLDPDSADLHNDLGVALLQDPARTAEAIAHLEAAIRLNPGLAEAHYVLGLALDSEPGRQAEARAQMEAALRANPGFQPARDWLEQSHASPR